MTTAPKSALRLAREALVKASEALSAFAGEATRFGLGASENYRYRPDKHSRLSTASFYLARDAKPIVDEALTALDALPLSGEGMKLETTAQMRGRLAKWLEQQIAETMWPFSIAEALLRDFDRQSATIATLSAERDELLSAKANMREYATMLVKLREQFINIKDQLEDEGDRVYFGSTNDADTFREVVQGLDDLAWDQIVRDSVDGPDIYAAARINHARAEAAEAQVASLSARVGELEAEVVRVWGLVPKKNRPRAIAPGGDNLDRIAAAEADLASLIPGGDNET